MDFQRYLASKTTVDDRALNRHVWQQMVAALPQQTAVSPLRVLELGAGIGTMVERLQRREVLQHVDYTAIDNQRSNIEEAQRRLRFAPSSGQLKLETIDLFDFVAREAGRQRWDLLIAHALLDLLDVPQALPQLFSLVQPGGLFYFTINFDGATILQPTIDAAFDAAVEAAYHQTMDDRMTNGRKSGDSQAGRHLIHQVREAGGVVLAAGSSDWVVLADENGRYPADEAFFLHFIIDTMHGALKASPNLDQAQFAEWIKTRHAQIDSGDLVYIAHQIDLLGRWEG